MVGGETVVVLATVVEDCVVVGGWVVGLGVVSGVGSVVFAGFSIFASGLDTSFCGFCGSGNIKIWNKMLEILTFWLFLLHSTVILHKHDSIVVLNMNQCIVATDCVQVCNAFAFFVKEPATFNYSFS